MAWPNYEAAISSWEHYEYQDDPLDDRTLAEAMKDVVNAALGDKVLYGVCPDCGGMGSIIVMTAQPDMHETEYECERCQFHSGFVQVWPKGDGDE